jgi:dihydroxy-acid dehydratase
MMAQRLNKFSSRITQLKSQGASQAMLYGTGMTDEDMNKPEVGIATVWWEGNTCNMHLNDLAAKVREGVLAAGLVGMRFNTVGVSDGIAMGTEGMSFSLQSRDLIADSIETVMGAQWYDANISIPGCDKNMPGCLMAMGRLNRPALMIYGGTIKPGHWDHQTLDIVSAFQSYGEFIAGKIDDNTRQAIVRSSCPGPGACGGMYTANTMASAIEALGMSLPYSSSTPAVDPQKLEECFQAGAATRNLLEHDIKPRDIMTREAFENAMTIVMALGGSTNAVLHLIAMARAVGVTLTIDDFQSVSERVPFLADLKPSGRYVMEDLHNVGGTPAVIKYLLENGLINGDCLTVTGKTIADNVAQLPGLKVGQDVVHSLKQPIKSSGHIQILRGNLAPGGAVAKITGKEGERFTGPARVFDSDPQRRRHRHPLRGSQRRPGDARDVDTDLRDHGRRTRQGRGAHYRWALFWRLARFHHRSCRARGAGGRTDRVGQRRRSRHDRRAHTHCRHGYQRGGDGETTCRMVDATLQGSTGHAPQVHQDGEKCERGLCNRRIAYAHRYRALYLSPASKHCTSTEFRGPTDETVAGGCHSRCCLVYRCVQ